MAKKQKPVPTPENIRAWLTGGKKGMAIRTYANAAKHFEISEDEIRAVVEGTTTNQTKEENIPAFIQEVNAVAKTATKKISKAKRVQEYLAKHPEAKPAEVIKALAKYGVKQHDVANVKTKMNSGSSSKAKKKTAAKRSGTEIGNGHHSPSEFIKAAFGLGLDQAITLLEKVKKAIE